jgi:hypothetical protein
MRWAHPVRLWAACALLTTSLAGGAEPPEPLDLKAVLGDWPFSSLGADWMLPKGKQVLDGVPFQIDGAILLNATNSVQRSRPGKFKVEHIAVGRHFEKLHLLAASDSNAKEGVTVGIIRLQYGDGSEDTLVVRSIEHVAPWLAPCHNDEPENTQSAKTPIAWVGQHSSAAQSDKFFRLFHVTLPNPHPDKQVTELSFESPKTQAGLITVAISTGPAEADRLADTITPRKNPLPDVQPRSGELVAGRGLVKSLAGEPLSGARVRVAAVRKLDSNDNSSSTSDPAVGTEAFADADGRFTLPPLPDDHLYRLLAAADGFQLGWYRGLDPKADPIEIRLKPLESKPGKYAARGRLVGFDGKPVSWATIEVDGVGIGTGTSWGMNRGFPSELVSGTNGEFTLSRDEPFTRVQTRINAAGFAPRMLWLDVTNQVTTIQMGPGFVLRGRLLKDGQPLASVRVGICGTPRWSEVFAGHFETSTSNNGEFAFDHIATNTDWFFYGEIASLKQCGALGPRPFHSSDHGETNDLGDIEVKPGLRLAGRVVTRDGSSLPKGTKIRVSSEQAWDSETASVDKEGHFALNNLYPGQLTVGLENRDWHLTAVNRSLDVHNPFRLTGLLETNKDDLVVVIQKGQSQYNYSGGMGNGNLPQQDWPENHPLEGAEPSGLPPIILAGQVVDDKTGDTIKSFKAIPGYKPPMPAGMATPKKPLLQQMLEPFSKKGIPWQEMPFWQFSSAEDNSNGTFHVEFRRLTSTPMLRIEAPGYEPAETEPISMNTSNLVVRLKTGLGPSGIVLLPNGQPAAGATVLYLALHEQCSLSGTQLNMYSLKEAHRTTGADGKFSFPVRAHGTMLLVSHSAGWAEESVERASGGLKVQLQPWATLSGTLMMNSNNTPAPNVELTLTIPSDWQKGEPHVNVQGRITTDTAGNFYFADVPPRRIEIDRIIPMSANSWQNKQQTWVVVQAGVSNNIGKVIFDTPPPPPFAEQVKQKLGL